MLSFKDYINEANIYYNTGGVPFTFGEFILREVTELKNYNFKDILQWRTKYQINDNSLLIWVSPSKKEAAKYSYGASEWDDMTDEQKNNAMDDIEYNTYSENDGRIIKESDDGDNGFLLIVRK